LEQGHAAHWRGPRKISPLNREERGKFLKSRSNEGKKPRLKDQRPERQSTERGGKFHTTRKGGKHGTLRVEPRRIQRGEERAARLIRKSRKSPWKKKGGQFLNGENRKNGTCKSKVGKKELTGWLI